MARKNQQPLEPGLAAVYSFVAILFPPVAVGLAEGCTANIALNLLLWILGIIPGWIHAFYLINARVRGPVVPLVSLPQHQQQAYYHQGANYYDPGRLESQLEATVIGPMKAGRMPEGATIHINPVSSAPPHYHQGEGYAHQSMSHSRPMIQK